VVMATSYRGTSMRRRATVISDGSNPGVDWYRPLRIVITLLETRSKEFFHA
jgi:hypothetical protein